MPCSRNGPSNPTRCLIKPGSDRGWYASVAADRQRQHRLSAGDTLFRQGDRSHAVFLVEQGRLRLIRHLPDGTTVTLHVARAGEGIAEAALFADTYHCDAVAEADSMVTALPKDALLAIFRRDPEAALGFARQLSRQVRDLRLRLELRNLRPASARVEAWLHLQASGRPPQLVPDRSWTEIATELGLTREAVYRALARLEATGRIRRTGNTVTLTKAAIPSA